MGLCLGLYIAGGHSSIVAVRDRAPPGHFAPFEHENLLTRTGEVSGCDQAVVAASDNDYVIACYAAGHLKATTANGGRVIEMLCGRPWLAMFEDIMPPALPMLLPP